MKYATFRYDTVEVEVYPTFKLHSLLFYSKTGVVFSRTNKEKTEQEHNDQGKMEVPVEKEVTSENAIHENSEQKDVEKVQGLGKRKLISTILKTNCKPIGIRSFLRWLENLNHLLP